jgi:lactosylceramide 4-alpha-galactosyltransferase
MQKLFAQPMVNETEEKPISWLTEKVVGVHVWNRMNKDEPIYKIDNHPYNHLARNNCPFIFSIAPEIF